MKYYLKLFSLPLSLLFLFISLNITWNIFDLPSSEVLLAKLGIWFDKYGLPFLFVSAFIEAMLLVGGYFPGVFVIFASVVLAESILEAVIMVGIATTGLFLGHIVNFILGKYGWYKLLVRIGLKSSVEESKNRLLKRGPIVIFGSYWLPSIGAVTDTAAGIIQMPFKTFFVYSLFAGIFWNSLVGSIVYILGDSVLPAVSSDGDLAGLLVKIFIIAVWIAVLFILDVYGKKEKII
ncbi:MAG: VTT domain-containing protein [bacterium]|nr:VTT domain-containing protein [bacterium]